MRERHPPILLSALVAAIALACLLVAGCGSSGSSSSTTAAATASGGGGAATIDVADDPDLGKILTDADGNTVYLFEKDGNGTSSCSGECATAWPPVTTSGSPQAGPGADRSLLGTIKREDGSEQVTYDGHPLYRYAGDSKPGDTNGNGLDQFGAEWYALTPAGSNAEPAGGGESTGSSTTSGGSGSSYPSY